jgi:hypothetical protein
MSADEYGITVFRETTESVDSKRKVVRYFF